MSNSSKSDRFHARARSTRFDRVLSLVRAGGLGADVEASCRALDEQEASDATDRRDERFDARRARQAFTTHTWRQS
jgi:hypothetical protein